MRKRNVQILFRLTEEEAEHLNGLVRKSGRSKEAFLREMVRGYQYRLTALGAIETSWQQLL